MQANENSMDWPYNYCVYCTFVKGNGKGQLEGTREKESLQFQDTIAFSSFPYIMFAAAYETPSPFFFFNPTRHS